MKVLFLGTGASDWMPEKKESGEYRRFSSALIDGRLMIDPGPHVFDFAESFGYDRLYQAADNIILTHSHRDHFDRNTLGTLCAYKGRNLWCCQGTGSAAEGIKEITVQEIPLFTPADTGGFTITALPANHRTELETEQAVHYIIERDGRRIFYGCDGAWLRQEAWYYMRDYQFDLMILDGTLGDGCGDYRIFEHNNLKMVELMAETIKKAGVLKPGGQLVISHMSLYAHQDQKRLEQRLSQSEIRVAFDGEEVMV